MQQTTLFSRGEALALAVGVGGPFEATSAILYTSAVGLSARTTYASMDAIKATFTGSAAKVCVWSAQAISGDDQPFVESQLLLWICTVAPGSPQDCYGVYYYNGTDLLGYDPFPAPVRVEAVGNSVQWVASVP
jgi:hypothetical protein